MFVYMAHTYARLNKSRQQTAKKARTGNFYIELDTYTPKDRVSATEAKSVTNKPKSQLQMTDESDEGDGELPF